jgi:hypothetical protein
MSTNTPLYEDRITTETQINMVQKTLPDSRRAFDFEEENID